jgi:hypothetical protein
MTFEKITPVGKRPRETVRQNAAELAKEGSDVHVRQKIDNWGRKGIYFSLSRLPKAAFGALLETVRKDAVLAAGSGS